MDTIIFILSTTIMYSTPLIFTSLGGVISENGGIINIGLEGLMYFGAFVGAAAAWFLGDPWLGFICAGAACGALALLHGFACITLKANNTISGVAINFIGPGLALFISRLLFEGSTYTEPLGDRKMPCPLANIFPEGSVLDRLLGSQYATAFIAFALVPTIWFILYRTRLGLRLRSVGEYPKAADTLGIKVFRTQYLAVVLSGIFAGFGGASISIAISSVFNPTLISGQGFIALAALVFGKWKPQGAFFACLIFGSATAISIFMGWSMVQDIIPVPSQFLAMFPFVISLVILVRFVGKAIAPSSDGIPYEIDSS